MLVLHINEDKMGLDAGFCHFCANPINLQDAVCSQCRSPQSNTAVNKAKWLFTLAAILKKLLVKGVALILVSVYLLKLVLVAFAFNVKERFINYH